MPRLVLVCSESAGRVDAIREYSFRLAQAVRDRGVTVDVCLRRGDGAWLLCESNGDAENRRSRRVWIDAGEYDAVVLQYNAFMYGKWGFAPWLPWKLLTLKRANPRMRIGLMVHEPYVPMADWKWMLMGAWQRAQLEAARFSADIVFASIEVWAWMLQDKRPFRPAVHLPVASNLPDRRSARAAMREHLKVADDDIVLASLSTGPAGRLFDYVVHSVNVLTTESRKTVVLNLGAGATDASDLADSVSVHQPGRLPDDELASWLSAADIFLAPFVDGVSTRRTSVMAALQHQVPVVGTMGRLTDTALRQATDALRLVPVGRPDLFAEAVVALARSPADAQRLGHAGRALYESRFDWPVISRRLLDELEIAANRANRERRADATRSP